MKGVLSRSLKVKKPVKGRFYLPWECVSFFRGFPGYCHKVGNKCLTAKHDKSLFGEGKTCVQPYDDQCIRLPKGKGVDADFVLYVTAKEGAGCLSGSETVATAGFCIHDYDNWYGLPGRPLAGAANFCPSNIYTEEKMFSFMLDTAVHEVVHALFMSKTLFGMYLTEEGKKRENAVVERGGHLAITTPAVVQAARDTLGCSTLTGAPLEDEGGYGTADSHWERRLFMGELMIGTASSTSRVVLSNLTLALAKDSGWSGPLESTSRISSWVRYIPDYSTSGILSAVEHRGCGFVERDCRRYNKDLEETFCWNNDPVSKQTAICSPDHMAVGYCNNDMSLLDDCFAKQPFSNLHCTNPAHAGDTEYAVDIGLRHQPGARCFQVKSFKIQRTENWMSVYRSNPGALCFDVACDGQKLYIHIPATKEHKEGYIRCPTGESVDLTEYGIGYDEGTIGPCPNNKLVCESWGCTNDCNAHGRCLQGKCYCDLGYVGKDCKDLACPEHSCKKGYTCHIATGTCYPAGTTTRPMEPSPKPAAPEMYEPEPSTPKRPEKVPKEEPYVPSTKPKKKPKTKPGKTPTVPTEPIGPPEEELDVPAYGDEGTSGKAVGIGYLNGCMLFQDKYLDGKVHADSIREYTEGYGEWAFASYKRNDLMVIDPDFGGCLDKFTDMRPIWRTRGFKTVRVLSAISTLVALTPAADDIYDAETMTFRKEDVEDNRYALERKILRALGLKDKFILQRDFILETYRSDDGQAKRALIFNAMIANTVVQISCFADRSRMPSFRMLDLLFRLLGTQMERGISINKLVFTDAVYMIVDRIGESSNGRLHWLLSETVARVNKMSYSYLSRYKGIRLLEETARLMKAAQGDLCYLAAELGAGQLDWGLYQDYTSKRNIRRLAATANVPDIVAIMSQGPENDMEDTKLNIPFLKSEKQEIAFVGALMGLLVVSVCVLFGCWRRRRPSGA